MPQIEYKILKAGYCLQNEQYSIMKGKKKQTKFYAMFVLIKHSEKGYILYDTGYSTEFYNASNKFPYSIYAKVTPVCIKNEESAKVQLEKIGIKNSEIKYIIISHFHADHIAGLKEFPQAKFICIESCFKSIQSDKGILAVKKAFLPELLPDDFSERLITLDKKIQCNYEPFNECYDIFEDNSILGIDLSGHAKGQMGIIINADKPVFFVSDACWYSSSYKKNLPPPLWVRLLLGNNKEYLKTLDKLHSFYKQNPNIEIIPSHCNEFWSRHV